MQREEIERCWQGFHDRALASKDTAEATTMFVEWFRVLRPEVRSATLPVLAEWILSQDRFKRFDAMALVQDFKLQELIPTLETLSSGLKNSSGPEERFLRVKTLRLLADLLEDQAADGR